MKKKVLSVVLTLVLALGVAVTAIGCGSALEDVWKYADKTNAPYSSATEVKELEGFSYNNERAGDFIVLEKENDNETTTYKIFNIDTGKVVYTATLKDGEHISLIGVNEVDSAVIITATFKPGTEELVYKLLTISGTEIASAEDSDVEVGIDLVKFDKAYYRVAKDGSVVKAFDVNKLSKFSLGRIDQKVEGYYYAEIGDGYCVYDENGNVLSYYQFPTYADEQTFMYEVLSNGNIFVQYLVAEDNYSDNYELLLYGEKYSVNQFVINPKNGEAKSVKDSKNLVLIGRIDAVGNNEDYEGKVENFATGYKVVDKKFDDNARMNYDMSNDGKLSEIEDFIPAQYDEITYANGFYAVRNKMNQVFLYNEKGELIGEVSGSVGGNNKYVLSGSYIEGPFPGTYHPEYDAIYDYSLNKVLDLGDSEDGEYAIVRILENSIILKKDLIKENEEPVTEYFLLKEGSAPVKICDEDNFYTADDKYYVVMNTDGKLDCYNEVGTKLLTVDMPNAQPATYESADGAKMLIYISGAYYYVA